MQNIVGTHRHKARGAGDSLRDESFDSWSRDAETLLVEAEDHLVALQELLDQTPTRTRAQGRRMTAGIRRHLRISQQLREEIRRTRRQVRRDDALARLGKKEEEKT